MLNHICTCVLFCGVANLVLQSIPSSQIETEQIAFELCYHSIIHQMIFASKHIGFNQ
jgi:hypothetical protein